MILIVSTKESIVLKTGYASAIAFHVLHFFSHRHHQTNFYSVPICHMQIGGTWWQRLVEVFTVCSVKEFHLQHVAECAGELSSVTVK